MLVARIRGSEARAVSVDGGCVNFGAALGAISACIHNMHTNVCMHVILPMMPAKRIIIKYAQYVCMGNNVMTRS